MTSEPKLKLCKRLNHLMPVAEFTKASASPDGLNYWCKACHRAHYQENREKVLERQHNHYLANKDRVAQRNREHYLAKKEAILQRQRERYQEKKGEILQKHRERRQAEPEKRREQSKEYRARNREKIRAAGRAYYQKHKDKSSVRTQEYHRANPERRKVWKHRYYSKKAAAAGTFTKEQWLAKCEFWGWCCYLCRMPLNAKTAIIEHRKPVSRGGSNWPANLAPACRPCNSKKWRKTEAEYRAEIQAPALRIMLKSP